MPSIGLQSASASAPPARSRFTATCSATPAVTRWRMPGAIPAVSGLARPSVDPAHRQIQRTEHGTVQRLLPRLTVQGDYKARQSPIIVRTRKRSSKQWLSAHKKEPRRGTKGLAKPGPVTSAWGNGPGLDRSQYQLKPLVQMRQCPQTFKTRPDHSAVPFLVPLHADTACASHRELRLTRLLDRRYALTVAIIR